MVVSTLATAWKVIDFVPILYKEGYTVLDTKLQNIAKDISNLCIGVNSNLELSKELAEAIGIELKKLGIEAVVYGTLDTLSKNDKEPLDKFSTSPYITVKILTLMAEGFANAGVYPIVDGRGEINEEVIRNLISNKTYLPVFVENREKMETLKNLGYDTTFYSKDGPLYGKEITLNWTSSKTYDMRELRNKLLKGSVVILNVRGRGVAINDPKSTAKVLIFSTDAWLLDLAKEVEAGKEPATGRRVW